MKTKMVGLILFALLGVTSLSANAGELIASPTFTKSTCAWITVSSGSSSTPGGQYSWTTKALQCLGVGGNIATYSQNRLGSNPENCSVSLDNSTSYSITGGQCYNYAINVKDPVVVPPNPPSGTVIAVVANDVSQTPNCSVRSVGGGYGSTVYQVDCPNRQINVEKKYSYGTCSIASITSGYRVGGTCSQYSVKIN